MGCDIHFAVERRRRDGQWERAEPLVPNTRPSPHVIDFGGQKRQWLYTERNYLVFTILSGMRNAGFPEVVPVSEPRGFPVDTSAETRLQADLNPGHSPSWVSLRELKALDWSQTITFTEEQSGIPGGETQALGSLCARFRSVCDTMGTFGSPDDVRAVFWYDS